MSEDNQTQPTRASDPTVGAPSTGYAAEQRESRKWWARVENAVKEVTGYSCKPHSPDMWWCPEVGYSLTEKYHLFPTEREALDKEIEATEKALAHETVRLANLKVRRQSNSDWMRLRNVIVTESPEEMCRFVDACRENKNKDVEIFIGYLAKLWNERDKLKSANDKSSATRLG